MESQPYPDEDDAANASPEDAFTPIRAAPSAHAETLHEYLARTGRLPVLQGLALALQLLSALEQAHAGGRIHGAVAPHALFVTRRGRLQLCETEVSAQDAFPYTAPEQLEGACDARSDLYAAGVVAYEILTGALPFGSAAGTAPTWPASAVRTELAPPVDGVFKKALAQDPAQRFASAQEFSGALQAAVGTPVWTRPTPVVVRTGAQPPARPVAVAAAPHRRPGVVAAALASIAVLSLVAGIVHLQTGGRGLSADAPAAALAVAPPLAAPADPPLVAAPAAANEPAVAVAASPAPVAVAAVAPPAPAPAPAAAVAPAAPVTVAAPAEPVAAVAPPRPVATRTATSRRDAAPAPAPPSTPIRRSEVVLTEVDNGVQVDVLPEPEVAPPPSPARAAPTRESSRSGVATQRVRAGERAPASTRRVVAESRPASPEPQERRAAAARVSNASPPQCGHLALTVARDLCVAFQCALADHRWHPVCVRAHAEGTRNRDTALR